MTKLKEKLRSHQQLVAMDCPLTEMAKTKVAEVLEILNTFEIQVNQLVIENWFGCKNNGVICPFYKSNCSIERTISCGF